MADVDAQSQKPEQMWLTIAAVVVVVIGLGLFLYRQSRTQNSLEVLTPSPSADIQAAEEVADRLQLTIPEGAERKALTDVSGTGAAGLLTRAETEDGYRFSIAAAIPTETAGQYQVVATLADGSEPVVLGQLVERKGGYLLETTSTQVTAQHQRVVVVPLTDELDQSQVLLEAIFE